MSKKKKGLGKFVVGAGIGAFLGVLFAPKKGSETRKELKVKLDELVKKVREIDTDELKENFTNKIEEIKSELEDLDKEKALRIAKEKSALLKVKIDELVKVAKEKGTPILQDMAREVKETSIVVIKEVLAKLEKNEK